MRHACVFGNQRIVIFILMIKYAHHSHDGLGHRHHKIDVVYVSQFCSTAVSAVHEPLA